MYSLLQQALLVPAIVRSASKYWPEAHSLLVVHVSASEQVAHAHGQTVKISESVMSVSVPVSVLRSIKIVCFLYFSQKLPGKFLPPATKLGQGYIFTGVCDSVHRGVPAPGGCLVPGGGAWSQWGYLVPWGKPLPGGCLVETHPPGRLLLWAVRILLECILVRTFLLAFYGTEKSFSAKVILMAKFLYHRTLKCKYLHSVLWYRKTFLY